MRNYLDYESYGLFVNDELYDVYESTSQLNDSIYGVADRYKEDGEIVKMEIVGYLHEEDNDGDDIPLNLFMPADFFERFRGTVQFAVGRKVMINKAGGNAGKESVNYRLSLPAEMVKAIGVTKEDKSVILELTGDAIVIKKKAEG